MKIFALVYTSPTIVHNLEFSNKKILMQNRGVSAALIVQFCANMPINLVETGRRTK